MLEVLRVFERDVLPSMLRDELLWNSIYVDYHKPFVERLFRPWGEYRIYLHRILPCTPDEALFHPHPWPSAIRILHGSYETAIGYGTGATTPRYAWRGTIGPGDEYEMTEPLGWHYVCPLDVPSMSLMITGKPWNTAAPKEKHLLRELDAKQKERIFKFFREYYSVA